jgi:hypothetical protein
MSASVRPVARSTILSLLARVVPIVQIDTSAPAVAAIDARRAGTATAMSHTVRMVGATVGAPVLDNIFASTHSSTSELHVATVVAAAALLSGRHWPAGNEPMRREGAIRRTR